MKKSLSGGGGGGDSDILCMCERTTYYFREISVCDLLGSHHDGKWAFIHKLHNNQEIYSHMR